MKDFTEDKIRNYLSHFIGKRVLDISQQDDEDLAEGKDRFVQLMFEDGNTLKFFVADNEAYKCGAPMCFSDPNPKPEDDGGLYHPTEQETAAGNWVVVSKITESGEVSHIVPTHGMHHVLEVTCWCGPSAEPGMVSHNLGA